MSNSPPSGRPCLGAEDFRVSLINHQSGELAYPRHDQRKWQSNRLTVFDQNIDISPPWIAGRVPHRMLSDLKSKGAPFAHRSLRRPMRARAVAVNHPTQLGRTALVTHHDQGFVRRIRVAWPHEHARVPTRGQRSVVHVRLRGIECRASRKAKQMGKKDDDAVDRKDRVIRVEENGLVVGSLEVPGEEVTIGVTHRYVAYWDAGEPMGICNTCGQLRPKDSFGRGYPEGSCPMCGAASPRDTQEAKADADDRAGGEQLSPQDLQQIVDEMMAKAAAEEERRRVEREAEMQRDRGPSVELLRALRPGALRRLRALGEGLPAVWWPTWTDASACRSPWRLVRGNGGFHR